MMFVVCMMHMLQTTLLVVCRLLTPLFSFLEEICQLLHGLLDELLGNIGVFYLLVYTLIYYQLNL